MIFIKKESFEEWFESRMTNQYYRPVWLTLLILMIPVLNIILVLVVMNDYFRTREYSKRVK